MIEFEQVGKTYRTLFGKKVRAVDGVTLGVAAGEVLGIAGPNGAGKSTLIALLLGYLKPSDGSVRIDGSAPRHFIERNGIGYLPELIDINKVWKLESALVRFAVLAGVPQPDVEPSVERVIELLGLGEHRSKKVRALSKGTLQRLGLAQALLRDERILILDEPTHGLDPLWTQRFRDIVTSIRHPDRAILIASHNLDELQRLADRVAILDRGQLQRVVSTSSTESAGTSTSFRIAVALGEAHLVTVFPGAKAVGRGAFDVTVADLPELNRGIARLIAAGAIVAGFAPVRSALEVQFREAVGEDQ